MNPSTLQFSNAAWSPPRVAQNSHAHIASKQPLEDIIYNLLIQIQDFDLLYIRSLGTKTYEYADERVLVRSQADPESDPRQILGPDCSYYLEVTFRDPRGSSLRNSLWESHGCRKQNKSEKGVGAQRMHLKYHKLKTDLTFRRYSYLLGNGSSDYKKALFWVSIYFRNEFPSSPSSSSSSQPRQGSVVPPHSSSGAVQSISLDQLIAQVEGVSAAASAACTDATAPSMIACTAPESASDTSPLQDGVSRFSPPQTLHVSFGFGREPSDMHASGSTNDDIDDDIDNTCSNMPTQESFFDSPTPSLEDIDDWFRS